LASVSFLLRSSMSLQRFMPIVLPFWRGISSKYLELQVPSLLGASGPVRLQHGDRSLAFVPGRLDASVI
jgi:hypothetical protein